jgi:cyclohexanone monooxygenase
MFGSGDRLREWSKVNTVTSNPVDEEAAIEELDALVVGGGFAGCYQLMKLRESGFKTRLYDAAAQLGGIWYWNCYPGARVDTTSPLYQYSREDLWRDWEYTQIFPAWAEIREYFKYVDRKLNLSKDVRLNTKIESASFDESKNQWVINTSTGATVRSRFFIICTGFASKPYIPKLQGLDTFAGICAHAGRWPQAGVDFTGKRVAVIGTGASGVQISEQSSLTAAQLTVFQRTPAIALPLRQRQLDPETQSALKTEYPEMYRKRGITFAGFDYEFLEMSWHDCTPGQRRVIYEKAWEMGAFRPWLGSFKELILDEQASNEAYAFWRDKVHARVKDASVAEKLAPKLPPILYGTKRMPLEQFYFDIFNKKNVDLVDLNESPIEWVSENGIHTRDKFYPLDILVFGTGFDAVNGGVASIDILGVQGQTLAEYWKNGFRTALGTASSGFPNMFFVYGPQSPAAWTNGPSTAEYQGDWVIACLEYLRDRKLTKIDATHEAEDFWMREVRTCASGTLLPKTKSWWFGANIPGKTPEPLYYAGGMPRFLELCWDSAKKDYEGFRLS